MRHTRELDQGWIVVIACSIIGFVSMGAGFYSLGVLLPHLASEFGGSRAAVSAGTTALYVGGALGALFSARWLRLDRARPVVIAGSIAYGLALVLLGQVTAMFQLYVLYALLGFFLLGAFFIAIGDLVSSWFRESYRWAVVIPQAAMTLSGALYAPLANWVATSFGWRTTYLVYGLLAWTAMVPAAICARPRGASGAPLARHDAGAALETLPAGLQRNHSTSAPATKHGVFWLIFTSTFLTLAGQVATITHLVALLLDRGYSSTMAAGAMSMFSLTGAIGKIGLGYLAERVRARYLVILCNLVDGLFVFSLVRILPVAAVMGLASLFGAAAAANIALYPLVVLEAFDRRSFAATYGKVMVAYNLGGALGPLLAGYLFDRTGSYDWPISLFTAGFVVASLLVMCSRVGEIRSRGANQRDCPVKPYLA